MEAAWHVSIIKKISWYLRLDHICSNASANSMLVISSESWNLRKPSPPWPKEDYHFVGICISKVTREFETVCIEEQKQNWIYAHFCFALTGALLTKTNRFCQVEKGNWPSENWKLHFTWTRMCCKSWVAILREAVCLQWGWIEPHLFKVADQGQGCTLWSTKINLNLLSVDLVHPFWPFQRLF